MAYFLLKTYDTEQTRALNISERIPWKQYHSKFKLNDIVFIYLIAEGKFDCAAEIVSIEKEAKKCHLLKLFDIKNNDVITDNKSEIPAMVSHSSKILLRENNQQLIKLLLENKT
jgi:hypothetical protein